MVAGQDRWTRGSAFQGFDAYVGATTVTLLNIGNGGVPKNTNGHLGAQIFVGSGGSLVCLSLLASALLSQVSTTSIFACVCLFGSTSLPTFTFDLGRDFMLYVCIYITLDMGSTGCYEAWIQVLGLAHQWGPCNVFFFGGFSVG
ncbi:hypothetical protein B0H13DRAFT_1917224 [Mycena leptocephala]|nr:hypothetical protein B0H13DRAFT_1917224 [Mycena leptocephala]